MNGAVVASLAADVAGTARMCAAAGLIDAFGHVSARVDDGGLLITPTSPLLRVAVDDVVRVRADGTVVSGGRGHAPLEVPLHAAVYRSRSDVFAICRGHGPSMVAWGTGTEPLPLLHGLGALAGGEVRVHADLELVTTAAAADAAASTLGSDHALLLLANGGFATGATLLEAATRLWFTEERARVALTAPDRPRPGSGESWSRRRAHSEVEMQRAMAWFRARFHDDADPGEPAP